MAWIVLIVAGMFEAVWAVALDESRGFRRPVPTVLFVIALIASMVGLAHAMTQLPAGTSYAVWAGVGATLVVLWGVATGKERNSAAGSLVLVLLVGSVVGLKVVS